jgi:hypothetical protein
LFRRAAHINLARRFQSRNASSGIKGFHMRASQIFAAGALALSLAAAPALAPTPARAIGCVSGAAAGAVAGHYAHHHAVLGAIGGCIAGHHMHKLQKQRAAETPTPVATPTHSSY